MFYYDLSDDLQNSLDPFIEFHDESGVEAFYAYAVSDSMALCSADVQYIDPAKGSNERALVSGLRTQIPL
jgi:porin